MAKAPGNANDHASANPQPRSRGNDVAAWISLHPASATRPVSGPPTLPHPPLPTLALRPHFPSADRPARATPPLLLSGPQSRRTPPTQMITTTTTEGDPRTAAPPRQH